MEYPVYFKNEGKNAREKNTPTVNFTSHSRKCTLPLEKEYSNHAYDVTLNIPRALP